MRSTGVTIASPKYLAINGTPKHPQELSEHQIFTYSYLKTPNVWQYQDKNNEEINVKLNNRVNSNSPEMLLELTLAGKGIIRTPKFNVGNKLETGELVSLFDDYQPLDINVYLVYASRKHMAAKVRSFIDFVMDELGDG